jgi:tungstate transport system substrate-binding protein
LPPDVSDAASGADRDPFKKAKTNLVIVFDGEKGLFNPYGVIAVNPQKHPHVKHDLALKFIDYITGAEGQKIIADFKVDGDPIFFVYGK